MKNPFRQSSLVIFGILLPVALWASGTRTAQAPLAIHSITLEDGSLQTVNPFANPDAKATVLIFISNECPISNRYVPEINRLYEKYSPRGVAFWLVHPDPTESAQSIWNHHEEYRLKPGILRDPRHVLVHRAHARITPEAAVFITPEEPVYCGRIDDRFPDLLSARPEPTRRELDSVLEAILAGKPVPVESAPAVGCYIEDAQ